MGNPAKTMRDRWDKRNKMIYNRYIGGETVEQLAEAFCLSTSRINGIIREHSQKKSISSAKLRSLTKVNPLLSTITDADGMSEKAKNKLRREGIYYIKDLEDKLPGLRKSGDYSSSMIETFERVIKAWKQSKKK